LQRELAEARAEVERVSEAAAAEGTAHSQRLSDLEQQWQCATEEVQRLVAEQQSAEGEGSNEVYCTPGRPHRTRSRCGAPAI